MPGSRIAPWRWLVALFILALGLGGVLGIASSMSRGAGFGLLALMGAVVIGLMALGVWLSAMYWRRIDEAAREGHKWAWFWGGNLSMMALLVGYVFLVERPEVTPPLWPGFEATPSGYVVTGGLVVVIALLLGYGLAWSYWWLWKNR